MNLSGHTFTLQSQWRTLLAIIPASLLALGACSGSDKSASNDHTAAVSQALTTNGVVLSTKINGLCVDAEGRTNGSRVVLANCTDGAEQDWVIASDGTVQTFDGKCLTVNVAGGAVANAVNGTPALLWDCGRGANQKWSIDAQGAIHLQGTTKCLDVPNQNAVLQQPLWVWDCNSQKSQLWRVASQRVPANPASIDLGETRYGVPLSAKVSIVAPLDGTVHAYFPSGGSFAGFRVISLSSYTEYFSYASGSWEQLDKTVSFGGSLPVTAGQRIEATFSYSPSENDAGRVYFSDSLRIVSDYWYASVPTSVRVTLLGAGGAIVPGLFDNDILVIPGRVKPISMTYTNVGPARNVTFSGARPPSGVTIAPVTQWIGAGASGQVTLQAVAATTASLVTEANVGITIQADGRTPQEAGLYVSVVEGQSGGGTSPVGGSSSHDAGVDDATCDCTPQNADSNLGKCGQGVGGECDPRIALTSSDKSLLCRPTLGCLPALSGGFRCDVATPTDNWACNTSGNSPLAYCWTKDDVGLCEGAGGIVPADAGTEGDAASDASDASDAGKAPAACVHATCASAAAACGPISDGCGAMLNCGTCGSGTTCSSTHACVASCVTRTCQSGYQWNPTSCSCVKLTCGCGGVWPKCILCE